MIPKNILTLMIMLLPTVAYAADFDGSKPLLCAMVKAIECDRAGACVSGLPEDIYSSDFFRIDFRNKEVSGRRRGADPESVKISGLVKQEDRLLMHGVDGAVAWSAVLDKDDGRVSVSVTDNELMFFLSGNCVVP